jgi:PAS domain S-box-containing protein
LREGPLPLPSDINGEMFRAALSGARAWLLPVLALACASIVTAWLVADTPLERLAFAGSVVVSAAVAVFFGLRLAQEGKRRHERLLALAGIVETTGDGVVAARLDRTITAWNSGAENLFGYTADEMIGASVSRIVPPGDEHTLQDNLEQMLKKNGMHTYEVKRLRKDGSLVDVQITLSPLRNDEGQVVGISSIIRDISERRRLEAEREQLLAREREARADAEHARALVEEQNRHLVELDRMKDDFVASVSHELRTPLTSISGYLDLMVEEGDELPASQRQYLSVVRRNSDRLLRLVGDLLFVAQVDAGRISLELTTVDLSAVIAESVDAVRPVAEEKHIDLLAEVEVIEMPQADRLRLGQVLDNVLSNAVKFTPVEGSVSVRAFVDEDHAVVEIADTGMGIAPEDQVRLFDRFFRTAAASHMAIPGTGLGLAIAKAIVESHDGTISISSEPGHGTTVRLELPVRTAEAAAQRYVETLL